MLGILQQPIEILTLQLRRKSKELNLPNVGDRLPPKDVRPGEPFHGPPQGCAPTLGGLMEQRENIIRTFLSAPPGFVAPVLPQTQRRIYRKRWRVGGRNKSEEPPTRCLEGREKRLILW